MPQQDNSRPKVLVHRADQTPPADLVRANRCLRVKLGPEPMIIEYRDDTLLAVVSPAEHRAMAGARAPNDEDLLRAGVKAAHRFCDGRALYLWLNPTAILIHLP